MICQRDCSSVRFDNGFAERKAQPESPSAVRNIIVSRIEHLKDVRLHTVRDTGAVIVNVYINSVPGPLTADSDLRTGLGVFNGIIDQIDQDLCDQTCVHPGDQHIIARQNDDMMPDRVFVNMP